MIELFEHNQKAYGAALSLMLETGKAAVIHPTGTGKSFIGFKLAEEHPQAHVCWLSPSEYIFRTQVENLKAVTGGYVPDNITFITYSKLIIMTPDEIEEVSPEFIILDEFHRCGAAEWGKGVERLLGSYPEALILGLSATNIRYLDNQRDMADELFDGNVASDITLGEAVVRKILPAPTYVISVYSYQRELEKYRCRTERLRYEGIRDQAEVRLEALRRALEKADGLDVVFQKHIPDRAGKYIVFCAGMEHLNEMVGRVSEFFGKVDADPHVYTVHAQDSESRKAFQEFQADDSKHLKLLFCIDMLNEGVHVEGVSGVILFRPTVSPIIYKQQIGRALSTGKGNKPIIFDIVNNFDNLYSIDGIQREMQDAMITFHKNGKIDSDIDGFRIIDEVRDSRKLFDELKKSLSIGWETFFNAAKVYFNKYGHLNVPKRYVTDAGLPLGPWLLTQRRVFEGLISGRLSDEQISRLTAIGMRWGKAAEASWENNYQCACAYFMENGNLDVPVKYTTEEGILLGSWIINQRQNRLNNKLSEDYISRLDSIGMVWVHFDYQWEKNYQAACNYKRENGNLDVPAAYVTADGFRLGAWLRYLRVSRIGKDGRRPLTNDQIQRLDELGMIWDNGFDNAFNTKYYEAERYYLAHRNLDVPFSYVTPSGVKLGRWVYNQRQARLHPDSDNTHPKLPKF